LHLVDILFPHISDDARSKSHQISDTVQTVYELTLLPNNTAVKHLYTNRIGEKSWLDIYRWGAGLAVFGRIRYIGQNILQSSFQTGWW